MPLLFLFDVIMSLSLQYQLSICSICKLMMLLTVRYPVLWCVPCFTILRCIYWVCNFMLFVIEYRRCSCSVFGAMRSLAFFSILGYPFAVSTWYIMSCSHSHDLVSVRYVTCITPSRCFFLLYDVTMSVILRLTVTPSDVALCSVQVFLGVFAHYCIGVVQCTLWCRYICIIIPLILHHFNVTVFSVISLYDATPLFFSFRTVTPSSFFLLCYLFTSLYLCRFFIVQVFYFMVASV